MGCGASSGSVQQQQQFQAKVQEAPASTLKVHEDSVKVREDSAPRVVVPPFSITVHEVETPKAAPDLHMSHASTMPLFRHPDATPRQLTEVSATEALESPRSTTDDSPKIVQVTDYICECLVQCGVTHIFGGHGGAVVPLIDSIVKHPKLTWVYMRCELNASLAAAAYAKLRQGLGCCVGTSGPGASHLLTGLMDAELDQCPVLCLTGMKNLDKIGLGEFQDIGQTEIFKTAEISYSVTMVHKQSVVPLFRSALSNALFKFACSHVAVPFDIQQMKVEVPDLVGSADDFLHHIVKMPAEEELRGTAKFIKKLRSDGAKCLIVVGCRAHQATTSICRLAETMGVPILTSLHAKGIVADAHQNNVGVVGIFGNLGMEASAELVRTADCIISIGAMLNNNIVLSSYGIQQRELVCIDVNATLLDKRCQAENVLLGDISCVCDALADSLDNLLLLPDGSRSRLSLVPFSSETPCDCLQRHTSRKLTNRISELGDLAWGNTENASSTGFNVNKIHLRPQTYEPPVDELTAGFCHPGLVLKLLGPKLNRGAVVCVDVGDVTLWVSLCLALDKPQQRTLASMRMGTMGYSVCAAVAAWTLRGRESQIVAVAGDGGVQMAINELGTLQQLGAKVLLIVFVNNKLGRVANEVWGAPGSPPPGGCEITVPDFLKLSEAYGGTGFCLNTNDEKMIGATLDKALAQPGICILQVMQDPSVAPFMAKNSSKRPKAKAKPAVASSLQVQDVDDDIQGP